MPVSTPEASEAGGGKYREAIRRARRGLQGPRRADRALTEGPYLSQCLLGRLLVGKPDAGDLRSLLDGTRKLTRIIGEYARGGSVPAEPPQATADVEKSLERLTAAYNDEDYALRTAADDAHAFEG